MRTITRLTAALAAAALTIAAAPADVAGYAHPDAERELFFAEQETWMTPTTTRVGNVDHENDEFMSWSTEAPADPVGGLTAATLASGLRGVANADDFERGQLTAEGTFTGFVDSMTFDLHYVDPYDGLCGLTLALNVKVDGLPVLTMDGIGNRIDVATETTDAGYVARIKLTNMFDLVDSYGNDSTSYVGDADTEHVVRVSAQQYPLCNEVVWTYGSTTFPTSIVFNRDPADPSVAGHTTIDAMNPPQPPPAPELP